MLLMRLTVHVAKVLGNFAPHTPTTHEGKKAVAPWLTQILHVGAMGMDSSCNSLPHKTDLNQINNAPCNSIQLHCFQPCSSLPHKTDLNLINNAPCDSVHLPFIAFG